LELVSNKILRGGALDLLKHIKTSGGSGAARRRTTIWFIIAGSKSSVFFNVTNYDAEPIKKHGAGYHGWRYQCFKPTDKFIWRPQEEPPLDSDRIPSHQTVKSSDFSPRDVGGYRRLQDTPSKDEYEFVAMSHNRTEATAFFHNNHAFRDYLPEKYRTRVDNGGDTALIIAVHTIIDMIREKEGQREAFLSALAS